MTIQQAIEKAIEGGWKHPFTGLPAFRAPTEEWLKENWRKYAHIFLDPLFWQSLGKAMGWYAGEWKQRAMDFFDETVCEGKDTESFFERF